MLRRPKFMMFCLSTALLSIFLLISSQQYTAIPNSNPNPNPNSLQQPPPPSTATRRQLSHHSDHQPLPNPKPTADPFYSLTPPQNKTGHERISWIKDNLGRSHIFWSDVTTRRFNARVVDFFSRGKCSVRFFMTWLAPASDFGDRNLLGLESLFMSNPEGCLVIVSATMDRSVLGKEIIEPLVARGFRVTAIGPDLPYLFRNTPVQKWFDRLREGGVDPGEIPLAQNLSNLMRLALLYKYGGVYLDTDFIILKDFQGLRNSIGAQSIDLVSGNWTRLNNAAMVFDRHHPILKKFMEEFASTFNGSRWGHNGPYLVSRVVQRVSRRHKRHELNLTVLPPMAFYPVGWTHISGLFEEPKSGSSKKWVQMKVAQLKELSYGVHLWNKQSRGVEIQQGSVVDRLSSDYCIICRSTHQTVM